MADKVIFSFEVHIPVSAFQPGAPPLDMDKIKDFATQMRVAMCAKETSKPAPKPKTEQDEKMNSMLDKLGTEEGIAEMFSGGGIKDMFSAFTGKPAAAAAAPEKMRDLVEAGGDERLLALLESELPDLPEE